MIFAENLRVFKHFLQVSQVLLLYGIEIVLFEWALYLLEWLSDDPRLDQVHLVLLLIQLIKDLGIYFRQTHLHRIIKRHLVGVNTNLSFSYLVGDELESTHSFDDIFGSGYLLLESIYDCPLQFSSLPVDHGKYELEISI